MLNEHYRAAALIGGLAWCVSTMASVATPLVIQSEAGPVVTSACLELPGQQLPTTDWWKTESARQVAPDFSAVMTAIANQDRQALRQTFDASWASKSNRVEEQATALINQFQAAKVLSVPYRVDLGSDRIYFASVSLGSQTTWVPFVFRKGTDGRWGYLPERGDNRWLPLILESLRTAGKASATATCAANDSRLTASLPVTEPQMAVRFRNSGPAMATTQSPQPAVQLVTKLRDAARKRDADAYLSLLTKEGASALAAWLKQVGANEADKYFAAWDSVDPVWYLDLSPVSVVVLADAGQEARAVYAVERNGRLEIMNISHQSSADALLKTGTSPLLRKGVDKKFFASLQASKR